MAKERIHNPKTHTDMRIRQRTTVNGKKRPDNGKMEPQGLGQNVITGGNGVGNHQWIKCKGPAG